MSGRVVVVGPARRSGPGVDAAGTAQELRERGLRVLELAIPEHPIPVIGGVRAALANRRRLRSAAVVHLELGALDPTIFWFALVAARLGPTVVVAHDAPRIVVAPGASLIGGGARWRDVLGHRVLSPLLDGALRRLLTRTISVGVVLTAAAERDWAVTGPARIVVAEAPAAPPSSPRITPSEGHHVLYAGFVGPSKGLDVLLEAWRGLGQASPLPLVIAGTDTGGREDERYAGGLRELAAGLPNPPLWRGWVPDSELARLFAAAAIVVVPYRRSNPASGVIVRAMVEGRAIVATRVPAALDALRDREDALLVAPGDVAGLRQAILDLLSDPALRDGLGAAAARRAAERFSWKRHFDGLQTAYRAAREGR